MANIREIRDKDGKLISFFVRVYRGRDADGKQLKPYTTTFEDFNKSGSEAAAQKKAAAFAARFEADCKKGVQSDARQTFQAYCEYALTMKESLGKLKHSTLVRYRDLTGRIYPEIGYIKLKDISAHDLNKLYVALSAPGLNKRTGGGLSPKTIIEHHRLISMVLETAVQEGLIPFNPAERATLPKVVKREMNFFQNDDRDAIFAALDADAEAEAEKYKALREKYPHKASQYHNPQNTLKWKALLCLLYNSGCRRGEALGLKWGKVDFESNQITIDNNLMYSSDRGIYEDSPKTASSIRTITLGADVMDILKEQKARQTARRLLYGPAWDNKGTLETDFVFTQEDGKPMHPDSVVDYLEKLNKRHPELPHLNAHAFRHTAATDLIAKGIDPAAVASRLGHSSITTTAKYVHALKDKDRQCADLLAIQPKEKQA